MAECHRAVGRGGLGGVKTLEEIVFRVLAAETGAFLSVLLGRREYLTVQPLTVVGTTVARQEQEDIDYRQVSEVNCMCSYGQCDIESLFHGS